MGSKLTYRSDRAVSASKSTRMAERGDGPSLPSSASKTTSVAVRGDSASKSTKVAVRGDGPRNSFTKPQHKAGEKAHPRSILG